MFREALSFRFDLPAYIWFWGRYEVFSVPPPPHMDLGKLGVPSISKEVLGLSSPWPMIIHVILLFAFLGFSYEHMYVDSELDQYLIWVIMHDFSLSKASESWMLALNLIIIYWATSMMRLKLEKVRSTGCYFGTWTSWTFLTKHSDFHRNARVHTNEILKQSVF